MSIVAIPQRFAIMATAEPEKVAAALRQHFPNDFIAIGPNQWLLVARGTAKEICDQMELSDGSHGSAVVVAFTSYYGRASTAIWDWIASRQVP